MILLSEIIPDFVTINNINKNRSDTVAIFIIYMYNIMTMFEKTKYSTQVTPLVCNIVSNIEELNLSIIK